MSVIHHKHSIKGENPHTIYKLCEQSYLSSNFNTTTSFLHNKKDSFELVVFFLKHQYNICEPYDFKITPQHLMCKLTIESTILDCQKNIYDYMIITRQTNHLKACNVIIMNLNCTSVYQHGNTKICICVNTVN